MISKLVPGSLFVLDASPVFGSTLFEQAAITHDPSSQPQHGLEFRCDERSARALKYRQLRSLRQRQWRKLNLFNVCKRPNIESTMALLNLSYFPKSSSNRLGSDSFPAGAAGIQKMFTSISEPKLRCDCLRRAARRATTFRGFTLLELLVVIGIVIVLVAILLPVINGVMEHSRTAKCVANLRQIGVAALLYPNDNNGRLPPNVSAMATASVLTFVDNLAPYDGNQKATDPKSIWRCPAATARLASNTLPDYSANEKYAAGNPTGVLPRQAWGTDAREMRLVQITHPSQVILFLDSFSSSNPKQGTWLDGARWSSGQLTWLQANHFGDPITSSGPAPRHSYQSPSSGFVNMVFCDGHVESIDWRDPRLKDPTFVTSLVCPSL